MTKQLDEMPMDFERALCVVAHPDDMEFGGAGAVASWTAAGKEVGYVLLTHGEAGIDGMRPEEAVRVREAEQRESAAIVGVGSVEFLGHPDGVVEYGVALRRDIAAAIRRHRPGLVVGYNHRDTTHTGRWNTADHRNTGRALLDAVADAGNRWIFPDAGEPWGGVRYVAMAGSPDPTHAVDVTGAVDAAVASLEAHRTYLASLGGGGPVDVRTPLTGLFRATGERFGGRLSIPFELVVG
ncbi:MULTISPECIES: PIG-L deacetylase family protein [Streptomyces]|uniref:LmbE family protein n=5 Tax=Streptomyces TaxID=1883 RepID=A0A380P6C2_STRGR|nr:MULTISPECIES: PIG-L deacetylase family protein [Streptomyces]NEE32749.1 PIG-L family deacetylase [Streptomyces sp. SID7982]NEE43529.1 PIG-L family deacetylase [Streptomyces sp. SID8455]MDQ0292089.1 LmbE family N-acetylglucosaminyl deacetylase [Streptomyces sp. DSM 41037]NEC11489.1 PIG-L family deacetylase [Streptomyces sp. SID8014]PJM84313.1 PIG-L domain-containing protein [Streptomyces sp. TSRI0384-2]